VLEITLVVVKVILCISWLFYSFLRWILCDPTLIHIILTHMTTIAEVASSTN
jgi:hypothetical protein